MVAILLFNDVKLTIHLLVVNYHSSEWIDRLLRSIPAETEVNIRVVIANNSPEDRDIDLLQRDTVTILDAGENVGFGGGCNLGLEWIWQRDREALVWLINPDAQLKSDSISGIVAFFDKFPYLSIVGTTIEKPNGDIWFAGGEFDAETGTISVSTQIPKDDDRSFIRCNWVSGCSTILNLKNFSACPKFDRAFFLYYEDFDFCQRYANEGHAIAIVPHLSIVHHPSSIADRQIVAKYTYSTCGYLLSLKRYATRSALYWRWLRLLCHAIALLLVKPKVAIGKLRGSLISMSNELQ